jgi:hypothetical protein
MFGRLDNRNKRAEKRRIVIKMAFVPPSAPPRRKKYDPLKPTKPPPSMKPEPIPLSLWFLLAIVVFIGVGWLLS